MSDYPFPSRELNIQHASDPQPGDYWSEMFSPVCVILAKMLNHVVICRKTKLLDSQFSTWDLDATETMTVADFKKWISYNSIDGCWADVKPQAMMDVVREAEMLTNHA